MRDQQYISLTTPAGVSLDQTVLSASFRWNFYFAILDINNSSRSPSLFLAFLCATFFLQQWNLLVLRAFCWFDVIRWHRRDKTVSSCRDILIHTYAMTFFANSFPGCWTFSLWRYSRFRRKKVMTTSEIVPHRLLDYSVSSFLGNRRLKFVENIYMWKDIRFTSAHFWRFERLIEIYRVLR